MELNPLVFDERLAEFLADWSPADVASMTLAEYADLNNHHSFCYWLEYGSPDLGAIGDNALTKFHIWIPKEKNKVFKERISYDGTYAWYANLGKTAEQAFAVIRPRIVQVIRLATAGEFAAIENIQYHSIVRWKIAMLYSGKRLLPIYSKPALLQVANGLDGHFNSSALVYRLQQFIISQKPAGEPMEDYAARVYEKYRLKDRRFYIFGSKYKGPDGSDNKDVFPVMLDAGDVAIGFMDHINLSPHMQAKAADIEQLVNKHYKDKSPDISKMRRYFKLLLQIREGDIIAVKSQGTHNSLTIIAYATVVSRNGSVYCYRPDLLGHHIHVEFMDWGFKKQTGLTYAETIHEIGSDNPVLKTIFGAYALFAKGRKSALSDTEEESGEEDKDRDEDDYTRGHASQVVVRQIHNMMQNRFLRYLKKKHQGHKVEREYENRIDVYRQHGDSEWLYEIKPFESPYRCIREGIGQLLDYAYRFKSQPDLHILIVGPEEAKAQDRKFIEHIRQTVGQNFTYIHFDYLNHP